MTNALVTNVGNVLKNFATNTIRIRLGYLNIYLSVRTSESNLSGNPMASLIQFELSQPHHPSPHISCSSLYMLDLFHNILVSCS